MKNEPDLLQAFAAFAANCRYEDLSPEAIDGAKKSILDTLGVMLAATGVEPAVRGVAELVQECGGAPEASILGFGGRAPAVMAGFANGAMAHCLDFDDHAPEGHHPSSSIVPAALALAEKRGGISGRDLITAVAMGQDMFLRIRRNVESVLDWHITTVVGVFSATATAAHVLGLNEEQTANAMGIAAMQSCGTLELAYGTGSDLRGLYAGFSTKGAVLSALLAQKGVTGMRSFFEGKAGLFNVYFKGKYNREKMLDGLGRVFSGGDILYKPWPSCGASHGFIHATLELMKEHQLTSDDIVELRVNVGDFQKQLCEPIDARRRPGRAADAKFSIPFCVAVAATHGEVKVQNFFGEGLKDAKVHATADKVVPVFDAAFNWSEKLPKGRLDIVTRDGRTLSRVGENVPGDEECPMSWDYIEKKFADCAALAANHPGPEKIARTVKIVRTLETSADATSIIKEMT
ncbi:MmgE/PrpD family protein [Hydrogenophaga sp.]|uniref:MmgE/PrpD family protein n=1 Tax=Hydrogenophaga sp. TaxID=1904254 RepID=UPI002724E3B8|nr:MmgE/PrpD family protein [Hydrogenophaga sp.]MDO9433959.1 MmgE/PrpD family protein [Hydrogenophaga sp.]